MYCELYRCRGRAINRRIYMYIVSHLISESFLFFIFFFIGTESVKSFSAWCYMIPY